MKKQWRLIEKIGKDKYEVHEKSYDRGKLVLRKKYYQDVYKGRKFEII